MLLIAASHRTSPAGVVSFTAMWTLLGRVVFQLCTVQTFKDVLRLRMTYLGHPVL